MAVILARPLFSPDRRPANLPGTGAPTAGALPRLTAIVMAPGLRQAVFVPRDGQDPVRLSEGERFGGYRLSAVRVDSVEFENVAAGGVPGSATLRLQADDAYRDALAEPPAPVPAIDPARREAEFESDQ